MVRGCLGDVSNEDLGPIPETIRSLWKSDRITNFSSAHDFSIRSDSTNDPASIGSWSWAILLATWIGVGSEISSQQLVILSVISPQLKSTNYRETLTGTWSVLCQQFVYFQWRYSHTHTCQIWHVQSVLYREQTLCACTELAMTLSYRHSWVINDVATPPIVTSWMDIISLTFFIQSWPRNFNSKLPSEWFMSWFNWQ